MTWTWPWDWECEWTGNWVTVSCQALKDTTSWNRTTIISWALPYCWDWEIQRWNPLTPDEDCEYTIDTLIQEPFCTDECKYDYNPSDLNSINTFVNNIEWNLSFWPTTSVIIWDQMDPFDKYYIVPYIKNEWDSELYIDEICVFKEAAHDSLLWDINCKSKGQILPPWGYSDSGTPINVYKWDISGIPQLLKYADNSIIPTLKHNWTLFEDIPTSNERINVRVSRPSIITVWWWTSYVKDTSNIANITELADTANWISWADNKNFVWAWVTDDISSYSKNVSDPASMTRIVAENDYNSDINRVTKNYWSETTVYANLGDFINYHWLENIFYVKDKNFEISWTTFTSSDVARTYIIENWNLTITSDFEEHDYSGNIAFVVKWWDIIINNNVKNIKWIYISIKEETATSWIYVWWNIKWSLQTSSVLPTTMNILRVNGALYWDVTTLVSQRIYILPNPMSWLIEVWTVVNFWSNNFRKPAPLVWKFIWDYLDAQKEAR